MRQRDLDGALRSVRRVGRRALGPPRRPGRDRLPISARPQPDQRGAVQPTRPDPGRRPIGAAGRSVAVCGQCLGRVRKVRHRSTALTAGADFFFGEALWSKGSVRRARLIVQLISCRRNPGALNLLGDTTLYGRNWGALEQIPFLHFELCYYQAIEQAIQRGLTRVEAGAQGEHKIARGYLPSPVYSAHWIADPSLRTAIARFLAQERAAVEGEMALLAAEYSPFRQTQADVEGEGE